MAKVDFDRAELAKVAETLIASEIDALPFGTIRLDRDGHVILFSELKRGSRDLARTPALVWRFSPILPRA
jgi:hypothetical protein